MCTYENAQQPLFRKSVLAQRTSPSWAPPSPLPSPAAWATPVSVSGFFNCVSSSSASLKTSPPVRPVQNLTYNTPPHGFSKHTRSFARRQAWVSAAAARAHCKVAVAPLFAFKDYDGTAQCWAPIQRSASPPAPTHPLPCRGSGHSFEF